LIYFHKIAISSIEHASSIPGVVLIYVFLAEVDGTNIEKWNMTELINVMILNTIFLIVYNQHIEEISYQNSWEVAVVGAGWKLEEDI